MHTIAIAAEAKFTIDGGEGPLRDDLLLKKELMALGHQARIIDWEDEGENPLDFDAIYVSTTWNACVSPDTFMAWLDACEQDGHKRLINNRAVLDTGFFKHRYHNILEHILQTNPRIRRLGRLVPSRYYVDHADLAKDGIELRATRSLADLLADLDSDPCWTRSNIVLKPVVSADGRDTFVFNRFGRDIPIDDEKRPSFVLENSHNAETVFQRLASNRSNRGILVQPYMEGVEAGEYSLTFIGRTCTHAVQKPKLFRADGRDRRQFCALDDLPHSMLRFAEELVSALNLYFGSDALARARVDLFDQCGTPVLCELECVEPNMNVAVVERHNKAMAHEIVQTYARMIVRRTAALAEARINV